MSQISARDAGKSRTTRDWVALNRWPKAAGSVLGNRTLSPSVGGFSGGTTCWVVLAASTGLVAACMGHPQIVATPTSDPAMTITDPSLFNETLRDSRPHVHDYWKGQESVVILQRSADLVSSPVPSPQCSTPNDGSCAVFYPDDGHTVYPGTNRVNVTVAFSSSNSQDIVFLNYSSPSPSVRGERALRSTSTVTINTTESSDDLPHEQTSRWVFSTFYHTLVPATTLPVSIKVEIFRGPGELPVAPPHPDFWKQNRTLALYEANGTLDDVGGIDPLDAGPPRRYVPQQPPVVPIETTHLTLRVYYNSSTPTQLHYAPALSWHGADHRAGFERRGVAPTRENVASAGGYYVWVLNVLPRMWDSPYANRTDWAIEVAWHDQDANGQPVGAQAMEGAFHAMLVADRSP